MSSNGLQTRDQVLQSLTGPGTKTEWSDEKYDVPPLRDADRSGCEAWLSSIDFLWPSTDDIVWDKIQKNWISFLTATSLKPNTILAPNRKVVRIHPESVNANAQRFRQDRLFRRKVQKALWERIDSLEALSERWPPRPRLILNQATDETAVSPFESLVPNPLLRWQRRLNAVWTSLVCFLLYSSDEGTLDEMGLHLNEDLADDILDIKQDELMSGCEQGKINLQASIHALLTRLITDTTATPHGNPLLWWMAILVRSAISDGPDDYISRGIFNMNMLPMDLDMRGRVKAVEHYCKVFILNYTFSTWDTNEQSLSEVQSQLNQVDNNWIEDDNATRPPASLDSRTCQSPAWRDLLHHLRGNCRKFLGRREGTVMHQIRLLRGMMDSL